MTQYQYASGRTASGRLALRRTAAFGASKSLLSVTPDAWERAYRFALANSTIFVVLSWVVFLVQPESMAVTLSAPAVFFAGAMISFFFLVRSGGAFAAVAWFILGAGVYFGLGALVGGLVPDPGRIHSGSESLLLSDLRYVDALNSSSVLLVLAAGVPFAYRAKRVRTGHALGPQVIDELLLRLFPAISVLALIAVVLQFIVFPSATNLIVRTFLAYLYMIIPFCLFTLAMLWRRLEFNWRAFGVLVWLMVFTLSLLTMSKFAVMSTVAPLVVGTWVYRRSMRSIAGGLLIMGAIYAYTGAVENGGRLHGDYDASTNSPLTRVAILADRIAGGAHADIADALGPAADVAVPSTLMRISAVGVQAYLMEQYDNKQPGTSLNDYWVAAVPRIIWPDKPIVTRFGTELYDQIWATRDAASAVAPTYSAEAYWNYGPLGVVVVSVLIGLEIGWSTQRWHIAAAGLDPAFFAIAFPTALSASFVESWVAANYVGGFLTIVLVWCCLRVFVLKLSVGATPKVPLR